MKNKRGIVLCFVVGMILILSQISCAALGEPNWDLNNDGVVDENDVDLMYPLFGSMEGDENYNENYDFNHDGVINLADILLLGNHFTH